MNKYILCIFYIFTFQLIFIEILISSDFFDAHKAGAIVNAERRWTIEEHRQASQLRYSNSSEAFCIAHNLYGTPLIQGVDDKGKNILFYTTFASCITLLIKAKADVNQRDSSLETPLTKALLYAQRIRLIQVLLDAKADVYHENSEGKSVLERFCINTESKIAYFDKKCIGSVTSSDSIGFRILALIRRAAV